MKSTSGLTMWAEGHVFYNMFEHEPDYKSPKYALEEYKWRKRLLEESPNGKLLVSNSLFNSLRDSKKIYLAHTTCSLDKILKSGCLYSSGGCLIGSIYCSPITKEGTRLRLHNLGKYIVDIETPLVYKDCPKKVDTLIFEIQLSGSGSNHNNFIGIDYLRLGKVHYSIYKELEYLLSCEERFDLHNLIINRIKSSLEYLSLCSSHFYHRLNLDPKTFLDLFVRSIDSLPILGYIYFEAISEYLMLYQDNEQAKIYANLGEFYNPSYKNLMYSLQPLLKKQYKLSYFKPSLRELIQYVEGNKLFTKFDAGHMTGYLADRLVFLTNVRLFDLNKKPIDWFNLRWDFENLVESAEPLVGHLIHRELRNFGRYPDFYFYFDQNKALQVWNYWNHMDVVIPFNGVIPKGEVGINPAYPDLKYKVYLGKVVSNSEFSYVEPVRPLKLDIVPRLVDQRFSRMIV